MNSERRSACTPLTLTAACAKPPPKRASPAMARSIAMDATAARTSPPIAPAATENCAFSYSTTGCGVAAQPVAIPVGRNVDDAVDVAAAHQRQRGFEAGGMCRQRESAHGGHAPPQLARRAALVLVDDRDGQAGGNASREQPQQQRHRGQRKPQQQRLVPRARAEVAQLARRDGAHAGRRHVQRGSTSTDMPGRRPAIGACGRARTSNVRTS